MLQHSSARVVFGLASIAIASLIAYHQILNKKDGKDTTISKTYSDDEKKGGSTSIPMFDFNNHKLARIISDMAHQRAKRWMSFQVTGASADLMVGQVGGKSSRKKPIMILENFVMKPVNPDHRGIREIAFYEAIQASSKRTGFQTYCSLFGPRAPSKEDSSKPFCNEGNIREETNLLHRLEPFTARYFGTVEYNQDSSSEDQNLCAERDAGEFGTTPDSHILLDNITANFSKPCVLDIKLGTKTFEPDAPEEKKSYELKKYPPQSEFGFRLTAMRIYDPANEKSGVMGYAYYPKQYGRSLESRDSIKQALLLFLGGADLPKEVRANRSSAIQRILSRLKMIKKWFRDNKSFSFCGSSILIVYEGDTVPNAENGIELDMAQAKMIDFGRVRRNPQGDAGYLRGVTQLIRILEEILKESFLETSKYIRLNR